MPQLDPTWYASQFFWLVICFFALYYVMSHFIAPNIADILAKRQNKIDEYIDKATATKKKAEEALQKYHAALDEANNKANQALERTKKELEEEIAARQNAMVRKLHKQIESGEEKIRLSKEETMAKVYDISQELAKDVVKKIGVSGIANENFKDIIRKIAKD
ncbi:MAG: hypothetical protein IJX20_00985 [Alphaproteobacteria bacterium]|nr:hypothetical protein [Alphaproteobacteria bacterium]